MKKKTWILSFFAIYTLIMGVYFFYCFEVRGLSISFVKDIQQDYAKYLIDTNDNMIDLMLEYTEFTKNPKTELSVVQKNQMTSNISSKNKLLMNLQINPPSEENTDYTELYKDILKVYAFYIQGDIMKMEYMTAYKDFYTREEKELNLVASEESFIMGMELTDTTGNAILDLTRIINSIRKTDISSKHNISELNLEIS